MAGILQGMGGSLSEEDLKKFGPMIASQGPMPTPSLDGNLIQAGSTGNAAAPLAGYLNKTSTGNPVISYVPPHLRTDDDVPEDGEGSPNDGITDGEDPIDSNGDGIPDTILPPGGFYDVGGGGDNPDGMGGQVGDVSYYGGGYNSFTDMFDGGGPGMFGGQHQGMFSGIGNAISGVLGQDNIANTGNISYAYTPASNNSVNTAPHPGIQYTAPAAAVLGLEDQTVDNWSAGQVDGTISTDTTDYSSGTSVGGPAGGYSGDYGGAQGNWSGPAFGGDGEISGLNQGGHVQYRPQGGSIWDTENQLRIQQPMLDQKRRQGPMAQKSSGGLLGTIMGIGKMASVLTGNPLMAMFNEGGSVKNTPVLGPLGTLTNNPNMLVPTYDVSNSESLSLEKRRQPMNFSGITKEKIKDTNYYHGNIRDGNKRGFRFYGQDFLFDPDVSPFEEAYKESSLGPSLGPLSNKQMKTKSYMKDEARKDMKFAIDEKRKQELHMKKLRS